MTFKPGDPKPPGSGRVKGQPNKMTAVIKDSVMAAFDKVGREKYLVKLAKGTPRDRQAFCALLAKCLPAELKLDPEGVQLVVSVRDYAGVNNGNGKEVLEEGHEEGPVLVIGPGNGAGEGASSS